jgi:hypothetical protein
MSVDVVVLNLSRYCYAEMYDFCTQWSELKGQKFSLQQPVFFGNSLRRILPEQANVEQLFCLDSATLALPYIVFTPSIDILNITAWNTLKANLTHHSRGVRFATVMRDIVFDAQSLFCTRMIICNSVLL